MPVVISNVKPLQHDRVRAFFSIELPSGAVLNSCMLIYSRKLRDFSVIPPQIPTLDQHGAIALNEGRGSAVR